MPPKPHNSTSPAEKIMAGCYAGRIRLLTRVITGLYDDALRPLGVTAGQLSTLSFIAKIGPASPRELAKELLMEKSTLSRNLALMERHGWVHVKPGDTGNSQVLSITRKGSSVIAKALPRWQEAQAQAERLLGKNGASALRNAFDHARSQGE